MKKSFTTLLALTFATAVAMKSNAQTLVVTYASGNSSAGAMFDLVALTDITITSFDGHFDPGTYNVEIWKKTALGTYQGSLTNQADWTLVGSTTGLISSSLAADDGTPTPIPIPINVSVTNGTTQAFYVTVAPGSPSASLNYTNGTTVGTVYAQNSDLQFIQGHGGSYFSLSFSPRVWNGTVHYTSGPPTGATNPSPADLATNTVCNPTLSWNSNGGSTFDVWLDTTNPPGTTVTTGLATNSYATSGLTCGQTYYWQIDSYNLMGNASSSVFSFIVTSSAPSQPAVSGPGNGATNLPTTVDLDWNASATASTYTVYLDTVNPPTTIATGGNSVTATILNVTGLATATTYYWRVDATNCCGTTSGTVQSFTTGSGPMSGNYTIPNDFPNFAAAVNALNLFGVGGPVTFLVSPGNYPEIVTLTPVTGASATNSITFQKSGTGDVTINPTLQTTTTPNASVYLNGADYFIFDGIDTAPQGAGGYYGYYFFAGASNNEIKNCKITTAMTSLSSSFKALYSTTTPTTSGPPNNSNNIHDNEIYNAYYTIYWLGPDPYDSGNTFSNNDIHAFSYYGMYFDDQTNLTISGNDIHSYSGTSTAYGMYFTACDLGTLQTISGNEIHDLGSGTGIVYGIYFTSSADGKKRIYNNMIYDFNNTGTTYGIDDNDGDDGDEIYHNTILIDNGATTSYALRLGSSTTTNPTAVKLNNNILVNTNTGTTNLPLVLYATTQFATPDNCDYNDLVGGGTNLVRVNTTNYTTLSAWQTASGFDANSISTTPGFVSATNPHIDTNLASPVDGTGIGIASVTTDFDGELRNDPPDIGADEFDYLPLNNDVGISTLGNYSPSIVPGNTLTISATTYNYGLLTQTFQVILTIWDSSSSTVFTNTQNVTNLGSLSSQNVTFAPYTVTEESFTFTVETQLSGDQNTGNNSVNGAFVGEYVVYVYPFNSSMASGWADANGTGASGELTGISETVPAHRGFIKFDLSGLAAGSTVNDVQIGLYSTAAVISTAANPINQLTSDTQNPATTFTDLFSQAGNAANNLGSMVWSPGPAPKWFTATLTNANAAVELANNLQDWIGIGVQRGSTNSYTFDGYNGTNPPYLRISFTPPLNDNAEINSVTNQEVYGANSTVSFSALVMNTGVNANTFNVVCSVDGNPIDTQTFTLAGSGTTTTMNSTWTGATSGTHTVTFTTMLSGDQDPTNDSVTETFHVNQLNSFPATWNFDGADTTTPYALNVLANGWENGVPTGETDPTYAVPVTGTNVWSVGLGSLNYVDNQDSKLYLPSVTLPGSGVPKLKFWHWYDIETSWDGGIVEYSTNGGTTWAKLIPSGNYPGNAFDPASPCIPYLNYDGTGAYYGTTTTSWQAAEFDLSAYNGTTISIRFRFCSDTSVNQAGWGIDNVRIETDCPSPQSPVTVTSILKSGNDAVLTWTASTGADNYKVYWDTVPGGTANSSSVGNVLIWTHTNGAAGSSFFYTVTATCGTVLPVASANKNNNLVTGLTAKQVAVYQKAKAEGKLSPAKELWFNKKIGSKQVTEE
ncbi:immune inhibitor A [bacterium]|nr:immune inhibitor A [bacterium]